MSQLRNQYQETFEELGEKGVRDKLSRFGSKKKAAAKQFLDELERNQEGDYHTRFEAFLSDELDVSRSAAYAAWASAEDAKTAKAIAKIALVVAIVAIAISIAGWFFD